MATKLSFTYSVGSPVIWTGYDNKRCIVRSSPGIWNGSDYMWFLSEAQTMSCSFAVPESHFRPMDQSDFQLKLPDGGPER